MKYLNLTTFASLLLTSTSIFKVFAYPAGAMVDDLDLIIDAAANNSATSALQARILIGRPNSQQSVASNLRVRSALIVPTIIVKTLYSLPGAIAAAIGPHSVHHLEINDTVPENVTSIHARGISTHTALEKRKYCCFFNSCYWCTGPGSGAGSVRPPRIFVFSRMLFSAMGSLPGAAAAAVPAVYTRYLTLAHPRDLGTIFTSSLVFRSVERTVGEVVELLIHHENHRDLVNEKIPLGIYPKFTFGEGSVVDGWEDRVKGAWVSVMGAAVAFARKL